MKTRFLALALILSLVAACSSGGILNPIRGNGNLQSQAREVASFQLIEFSGVGDLIVHIGQTSSVSISAEENLLPHIITEVKDNTLRIRTEDNVSLDSTSTIRYEITTSSLEGLMLSGIGNVQIDALSSEHFRLVISGAGNVTMLGLETGTLNLQVSGAGSVTINGIGTEQILEMSGAGSYEGGNFATVTARITLSGAGHANLRVSDSLTGDLSGIGNIGYYGSPDVNINTSGLGSVSQLGQ